ncbi:glycine zipper 2TM domain-containing protein [Bisgaard Taxon 10/6]|uniref:Glycine zipper 2TM domain-containing protein n=2 Tax=Exercitatus varius TaxID=67857 RepID=A0AAW6Q816_9PAST|nr:glycine zipper 2TM domain-containing protein [Exercitatus varius]MDG2917918.1 glycine zipper 2TM domain-containing protein [Exercitatus varius]MDG2942740.1 glycine zipper 2TM domain-containing protein [Exercitatus varius]MDG2947230.1 glycine zipper 2TM domain-containing protein [Exercitatus varius]MDG2949657.1 glycine zipper 2TM domain-containing protein [Exercitatus varius]MDG2952259.1 glycine zipper 2TM domain-containing protein [Exercitatus varius]
MKSIIAKGLTIALLSTSVSAYALSRSQHDTAVGAVLGGVAGAVMGNDVTSTVAGAALGGVIGSQWNADDGDRYHRYYGYDRPRHRFDRHEVHHRKFRHDDWRPHRHHRHHDDDDD